GPDRPEGKGVRGRYCLRGVPEDAGLHLSARDRSIRGKRISRFCTFGPSTEKMTNFIPVFPLGIVVYPCEKLNLHIFEPRYKQLVNECYAEGKPFGIPAVIAKQLNEMGTLVRITEVVKVYDNGEMDIRTEGLRVFRVLEVIRSVPDKLFSGAIVNYP